MSNWLVAVLFCVGLLALDWAVENPSVSAQRDDKGKDKKPAFRTGAVRYQVKDVDRSVTFYTKHLGFKVELAAPAFASVSNGNLTLWLSGPNSSGSRALPRWPQAGAGRVEPDRPRSRGSQGPRRGDEESGTPLPKRNRGGSGRQANPARGSRRQPSRAIRAV